MKVGQLVAYKLDFIIEWRLEESQMSIGLVVGIRPDRLVSVVCSCGMSTKEWMYIVRILGEQK